MKTHAYSAQGSVENLCHGPVYDRKRRNKKREMGLFYFILFYFILFYFILFSHNILLIGPRNETNLLRIVWPFLLL
jgi:hypothetical protein